MFLFKLRFFDWRKEEVVHFFASNLDSFVTGKVLDKLGFGFLIKS